MCLRKLKQIRKKEQHLCLSGDSIGFDCPYAAGTTDNEFIDSVLNNEHDKPIGNMQITSLLRTVRENHASTIAIIFRSELDYLSRCIADYPNSETGGHLFGYWTVQGVPVILYVTGPGPNCMHGSVECHHDYNHYKQIRNILENMLALQHIGDWHSHHQLSLNHPSGGDIRAMLAGVGNGRDMLRRHLMCIGTCDKLQTYIDAYTFHQNDVPDYTHAAWSIIETESPFRNIANNLLKDILVHPLTNNPKMGELFSVEQLLEKTAIINSEPLHKLYWLDDREENRDIMKRFIEVTMHFHPGKQVEIMATDENYAFISIEGGKQSILFAEPFPQGAPYYYNGDNVVLSNIPWDFKTLEYCFSEWLSQVVNASSDGIDQSGEKGESNEDSFTEIEINSEKEKIEDSPIV